MLSRFFIDVPCRSDRQSPIVRIFRINNSSDAIHPIILSKRKLLSLTRLRIRGYSTEDTWIFMSENPSAFRLTWGDLRLDGLYSPKGSMLRAEPHCRRTYWETSRFSWKDCTDVIRDDVGPPDMYHLQVRQSPYTISLSTNLSIAPELLPPVTFHPPLLLSRCPLRTQHLQK